MGVPVSAGVVYHVDYPFTFTTAGLTNGIAIGGYVPEPGDLLLPGSGIDLETPWVCTGTAKAGLYIGTSAKPFTLVAGTNFAALKSSLVIATHGVRGFLGLTTTSSKPVAVVAAATAVYLYLSSTGAKFVAASAHGTATPTFPLTVTAASTKNKVTLSSTTYISVIPAAVYASITTLIAALNSAPAASTKTAISKVLTFGKNASTQLTITGNTGVKGGVAFNTKKLTSTTSTNLVTALKLKTRTLTGGVATPVTTPTAGAAVAHLVLVAPAPA